MLPGLTPASRRVGAAAVLAVAIAGLALSGFSPTRTDYLAPLAGLAYLLPALALAAAIALGRYPGERSLLALAARHARPPRRRKIRGSGVPVRTDRALVPRGGLLIASSLAVRPPPAGTCAV
jgi:hypothetical protein